MRSRSFPHIKFFLALLLALSASQSPAAYAEAPRNAELRAMLSDVDRLSNNHDYDAALPIANAAVAKFPNDYLAHVKRGLVYMALEEDGKAIVDFEWALKQRPNDWSVLESMSTAYSFLGKQDLALKYIDLSLANRKDKGQKPDGWMKKKDILKRMKRYKEAEEANTMALNMIPSPHWFFERLKLRVENAHWQGAIEDANHILPIMPKFRATILEGRAKSYIGLKRYAEAERDLKDIIKTKPYWRPYHQELVNLYKLTGKKDLAEKEEKIMNGLGDQV
jgi:tetratricopeptide (TPR) repeat protein